MCVVAVKYFKGSGWVGVKNRDRNYQPTVQIVQSNRTGVQRLYLDDLKTRYTEGVNEFGLSILSASLSIKSDEKEADKVDGNERDASYMSPDGKDIRDALLIKSPMQAIQFLIKKELAGCTFVFNEKECYLLEGGFTIKKADAKDQEVARDYIYKVLKIADSAVRTNHGVVLPELGYKVDATDPYFARARKSSEVRRKIASDGVKNCTDPLEMMNAISETPNKDPFMNPIRTGDTNKGDMVTTAQVMLVPKEKTMHYRPLYSEVQFKYNKLNGPTAKTFFEIISSKKLLGFKEHFTAV
jgi:hypothetical protein